MANARTLIHDIEAGLDHLRTAERKVADVILEDPELVIHTPLAVMAERAGVSEPTVIRFCRATGCAGYPEFKLKLAQSLAAGTAFIHREIGANDTLATIVDKVFTSSLGTLSRLKEALDHEALERAIEALAAAGRVDCYGVGLSTIAAMDAHQKFMRLGVASTLCPDGHLQTMAACTLKLGDCALAFSYTGEIKDIVRTARHARAQGAFVIGVTRHGTTLADACSMTLAVETIEDTFIYAPMTTRLAHLVVVDILATSVALRRGGDTAKEFQRIKDALEDQWIVGKTQVRTRGRRSAA